MFQEPLEVSLLSDLECPICLNYLFPPIRQCQTGHVFCENCFKQIPKCPHCRAPKSSARCFTLENVHAKLTFPCRYNDEGCKYSAKGVSIKSHEYICDYTPKKCPLRSNDDCTWHGFKKDILHHCVMRHGNNTFFTNQQKFICSNFSTTRKNRYYIILFHTFNELFRCCWDLNADTGRIRFAVYYAGQQVHGQRFSFRIAIFRGDTKLEALSMKAVCESILDDNKRFDDNHYVTTQYDMVKKFCNQYGHLNYLVEICDNEFLIKLLQSNLK